jgi:integration host factor subunit alpha
VLACPYRKVRLSRSESSALVELVLKEISEGVARGEIVKLSSFGTFIVRRKRKRIGRNPKSGAEALISPRRVVVFKASGVMKQQINGHRSIAKQSSRKRSHSAGETGTTPK